MPAYVAHLVPDILPRLSTVMISYATMLELSSWETATDPTSSDPITTVVAPSTSTTITDLLDLTCIRERLLTAAQADGCRASSNLSHAIDVLFYDVMSRFSTLDQCAAQIQHANEIVAENRQEMEMYRQYVVSLEKCIAEQAAREIYMRGQVDRRNATLAEQRNEFYEQLLALKALITERDISQRLHSQQLHGTTLRDYSADYRPILQRKGSQITFKGDGRIEAAEWNRLLQDARAKLDNRTKTFELQMDLLKEELQAARQQSTNLAELVDRYQKQQKELREQLRMVKLEKSVDDAKAAEQIQELQARIRLLEERLENSVSSVTVSKALQQGDINMRSQISAMTRSREELERQHAEEIRGLKETFAAQRKQWKQKEEQMMTNFSMQIFKLEQASRQQQAVSQFHRVRNLSKGNSQLKATVPDANTISFDNTSQPSTSLEQKDPGNNMSGTSSPDGNHSSQQPQPPDDQVNIIPNRPEDNESSVNQGTARVHEHVASPTRSQRLRPFTGGHRRARSDGMAFAHPNSTHLRNQHTRDPATTLQIPETDETPCELEPSKPINSPADEFDRIDHERVQEMIGEILRDANDEDGMNEPSFPFRDNKEPDLQQTASHQYQAENDEIKDDSYVGTEHDYPEDITRDDTNRPENRILANDGSRPPSQGKGKFETSEPTQRPISKRSSAETTPESSRKSTPFVSRIPSRVQMIPSMEEYNMVAIDEVQRRSEAAWDLVLTNSRAIQCDLDEFVMGSSGDEIKQRRAIFNWKTMYQFVLLQNQSGRIETERAKKSGRRKQVHERSPSPHKQSGLGSQYSNNTPRSMRIIFDDDPDRPIYRIMTPRLK